MEAPLKIKSQSKCQIQKITTSLPCFIQELAPFETFERKKRVSKCFKNFTVVCYRLVDRPCQTIPDLADAITRIQRQIQ